MKFAGVPRGSFQNDETISMGCRTLCGGSADGDWPCQCAIFRDWRLSNFDAANYEGRDAYGFEVQIDGITPADLWPSWCGNKFGCPVTVPYATDV
jgi:hypothetical protein